MRIRAARLEELELRLVEPFETSFGVEHRRRFLLLELEARGGEVGYGECAAALEPLYSGETVGTAREVILRHLLPLVFDDEEVDAHRFLERAQRFRGNRMAKSAVETALVDLEGRERNRPVSALLGRGRSRVEVGVSVGILPSIPQLVRRVGEYLDSGYRRIKLKVRPGWDVAPLRAVRAAYPDIELWVDGNQGYPVDQAPHIARWARRFRVAQVEQPFVERAIGAHARLARAAPFRVCLDESVVDDASLDEALDARALSSLNVKTARVGGLFPSRDLARRARARGAAAWVGGMLESGVGRAANVHLASQPEFTLPADLSASDRYYAEDLIDPPFRLGPGSTLTVPRGAGLGVEVVEAAVRRARRRTTVRRG